MRGFFSREELKKAEIFEGNDFTNNVPTFRIPTKSYLSTFNLKDRLYDLKTDINQNNNIITDEQSHLWCEKLRNKMSEVGAPESEFVRLGLEK